MSVDVSFTRRSIAVQLPAMIMFQRWVSDLGGDLADINATDSALGTLATYECRSPDRWTVRLYCHVTSDGKSNG